MKSKDLTIYELAAITRGKEVVVSSVMESILSLMWERGIKNLDEIDGETFATLERSARMEPSIQAAFEQFLVAYAKNLDAVMSGEEAPF